MAKSGADCDPVPISFVGATFREQRLYCGCDWLSHGLSDSNGTPKGRSYMLLRLMTAPFTTSEELVCRERGCVLWARRRSMRFAIDALRHPPNWNAILGDPLMLLCATEARRRFRAKIGCPSMDDEKFIRKIATVCLSLLE